MTFSNDDPPSFSVPPASAAKSAGIRTVILPDKNEKDLEDVAEPVKASLQFRFVSEMDGVLDVAFGEALRKRVAVDGSPAIRAASNGDLPEAEPEEDSAAVEA